jgi:hypothetical protein
MATFYSTQLGSAAAGPDSLPVVKAAAPEYAGTVKIFQATINLATVNGGAAVTTSDNIALADVPSGYKFLFGVINTSATLSTSTVAIGITGATGAYRAAAVLTAVDTPAFFAPAITGGAAAALTATTRVFLTPAVASLPTSGTVVVQLFFALDN